MTHWALNAKCRSMDPADFFTENLSKGNEDFEAQLLCAGCGVVPECADDALKPMDVTTVLKVLGHPQGPADWVPVSGVVRAGMVIP